jgi:hypothetical protein
MPFRYATVKVTTKQQRTRQQRVPVPESHPTVSQREFAVCHFRIRGWHVGSSEQIFFLN